MSRQNDEKEVFNPVLNAEGYKDLTAYLAIYKGDVDKMKDGWNDGDIIRMQRGDDSYAYRIIIKMHSTYATTAFLFPNVCRQNEFEIDAEEMLHADLGKIGYTSIKDLEFAEFVRNIGADRLKDLREQIASTMGVEMAEGGHGLTPTAEHFKKKCESLNKRLTEAEDQISRIEAEKTGIENKLKETMENGDKAQMASLSKSIVKASVERDVYKELYHELLQKIGA